MDQKLIEASRLKDEGNSKFKENLIKEGLDNSDMKGLMGHRQYSQPSNEQKSTIKQMTVSVYNNMAACYIKNCNWEKAIGACDKVLEKEGVAKAFYRRGHAYLTLDDLDKAEKDLLQAVKMNPNDIAIRNDLIKLRERQDEAEEKRKRQWMGFLNK